MQIRTASLDDFEELYAMGRNTPEFKVSSEAEFMDAEEFRWSIQNPHGVFLLAQEQREIAGFVYANARGVLEKPLEDKYACIVYLTVIPNFRKRGIAQQLYAECERKLKALGITHLYGLAHVNESSPESNGIISFMEGQGFTKGKKTVWMDKKIS